MSALVVTPAITGFKCTFSFLEQSELLAGWTESFYASATSIAAVRPLAGALAVALAAVRATGVTIPRVRMTPIGGLFRAVSIGKFGPPIAGSNGSAGTGIVQGKALIQLVTAAGQLTRQWLGGLPYTNFTSNGIYTPTGSTQTAIQTLFALLASAGWQVRTLNQANAKILGATVTVGGVWTSAAHGLTNLSPATKIRMGRWPHGFGVNGVWPVSVIDANTFTLVGWTPTTPAPAPTKSSYWQLQAYQYTNIASNLALPSTAPYNQVIRGSEHKVGRPSPTYSGRRKPARS